MSTKLDVFGIEEETEGIWVMTSYFGVSDKSKLPLYKHWSIQLVSVYYNYCREHLIQPKEIVGSLVMGDGNQIYLFDSLDYLAELEVFSDSDVDRIEINTGIVCGFDVAEGHLTIN